MGSGTWRGRRSPHLPPSTPGRKTQASGFEGGDVSFVSFQGSWPGPASAGLSPGPPAAPVLSYFTPISTDSRLKRLAPQRTWEQGRHSRDSGPQARGEPRGPGTPASELRGRVAGGRQVWGPGRVAGAGGVSRSLCREDIWAAASPRVSGPEAPQESAPPTGQPWTQSIQDVALSLLLPLQVLLGHGPHPHPHPLGPLGGNSTCLRPKS